MAAFKDFMAARFTTDEQATELYKLLLQTGTYTETTVAQEVKALIDRNLDPSKMTEEDVRKFLSFFYIPIRNYVAAYGTASVEILTATGTVTFGPGDELVALGGATYQVISSGIGVSGDTVDLQVKQLAAQSQSGTYGDFISLSLPNLVMESLHLYISGVELEQVTSPRNGYMAFYFDQTLYIKVFLGTDVSHVRGLPYTLVYATCDGLKGNIDADSFSSFSQTKLDINLVPITYAITNDAIANGASAPSLGELRDLLRYWLFVRNVLTKPSDYRTWFLTQPEVGDCLAWGDTEEYQMGAELDITGKVRICLLSAAGIAVSGAVQTLLNARIQPYKDVAYLWYVAPTFVSHYFEIKYMGSNNDATFAADVLAELQARYNIDSLREVGLSLFEALDVGLFSKVVSEHITIPRGVEVIPYYYLRSSVSSNAAAYSGALPSPTNLKRGYTYYTYEVLSDDLLTVSSLETYTELMTSAASASIIDSDGYSVGTHNYDTNVISITITPVAHPQRITVYGEALSRSYLDTGAFTAARLLAGVKFTKVIPQF